ncbi:MAG: phosphoribosylamine--glycine ligase [Clostridiales bacterium]|jgi:phosphoribosylamine--glycine ligase|nr:phosphoribosylamine--glycine ligase [Clostridiales bacterium]
MKILVIGAGGREHAIIRKLKENPDVTAVYALPGNGGIAQDAVCVPGGDVDAAVHFAVKHGMDFVVVSPDGPLCAGMTDALEAAGVPAFGPSKAAAALEGSKIFAKELMRKYDIPTAAWAAFDDPDEARAYLRRAAPPCVIKADGPALGKGSRVCHTMEEALDAVAACMERRVFGESGARIVIEECLTGPEVSVLTFTDGETIAPMISAMDHKRALDNDEGPNTGGMGAVAPILFYTPDRQAECMERIFQPTVRAMRMEGRPFKGCLYFGLMLTPQGPKVIEYNARFGDPEAQTILPLMQNDLLTVMRAVRDGRLADAPPRFRPMHSCCVVLASGGYPGPVQTGFPIHGLNADGQISLPGATIFHAGVKQERGHYVTAGGRVLSVVYTSETLAGAIDGAYQAAYEISFEEMQVRRDIGQAARRAWEDTEARPILQQPEVRPCP